MKIKTVAVLIVFGSFLAGPAFGMIYKNSDFGYVIDYPGGYTIKEFKWVKESLGIDLSSQLGSIRVQAMPAGTDYTDMPFEEYARIAAISEVQNYQKLLKIERFDSDHDIAGYKTYWQVVQHEDTDKGPINTASVSGPIFYFPPYKQKLLGQQPVKTIMISFGGAAGKEKMLEKDAERIARSFRYTYSFLSLFRKKHAGKRYYVLRNEKFTIELPSNPTTGFNWFLDQIDEKYFKVESSGFRPAKAKLVGAPGVAYFDLLPIKDGKSQVKLLYYRPWEGPAKAVDSYSISIAIKDGD